MHRPGATWLLVVFVATLFATSSLASLEDVAGNKTGVRTPKILSLFQVVRFSNDACNGTSSRSGTCYTADECDQKKGNSGGSCAGGFGVCCIFSLGCGQRSNENSTYFERGTTGTAVTGACKMSVCKCDNNICQLRLDFDQFVITGPSTITDVVGSTISGVFNDFTGIKTAGGAIQKADFARPVSFATQCATDTFTVSNRGGFQPPVVCGNLMGQHMYVDANEACNDLTFLFGSTAMGAQIAARQWSIKVTQYSCDYDNLAPSGCVQYFFGPMTGTLQSFNFGNGIHLADQRQTMCIRRERTSCRACFFVLNEADFVLSGTATDNRKRFYTNANFCCGYGERGMAKKGFDCVHIPGLQKDGGTRLGFSRFCGRSKKLGTTMNAIQTEKTLCTSREPFQVAFMTDNFEFLAEHNANRILGGLRLTYVMDGNNCASINEV